MVEALIASPSVSCSIPELDMSNRPVAELLAGWLDALGFRTQLLPIPGHPTKVNVLGVIGEGTGGLVLAGHLDTVPFDEGEWNSDPLNVREADDRMYGLGTADMKSFFAAAVHAAASADLGKLKRPLMLLGTADEESSMSGARALRQADMDGARLAVVGEPTSLRPVNVHKGVMMESIQVIGSPGHSSDPSLGRNALEGMHRVIAEILDLRDALRARVDRRFLVDHPTINLGYMNGGDIPNRICADCELHLDVRLLPGMDVKEVREELMARTRRALDGSGLEYAFTPLFEGLQPLETRESSDLVRIAHEITGEEPTAVGFATEAPFLAAMGMDAIVLGPGDIRQAHQPDEHVAVSDLRTASRIYREIIERSCMEA